MDLVIDSEKHSPTDNIVLTTVTYRHKVTCCKSSAISFSIWSTTIKGTVYIQRVGYIGKCYAAICNFALVVTAIGIIRVDLRYYIFIACPILTKSIESLQFKYVA